MQSHHRPPPLLFMHVNSTISERDCQGFFPWKTVISSLIEQMSLLLDIRYHPITSLLAQLKQLHDNHSSQIGGAETKI